VHHRSAVRQQPGRRHSRCLGGHRVGWLREANRPVCAHGHRKTSAELCARSSPTPLNHSKRLSCFVPWWSAEPRIAAPTRVGVRIHVT
jgi:hypothetical protein